MTNETIACLELELMDANDEIIQLKSKNEDLGRAVGLYITAIEVREKVIKEKEVEITRLLNIIKQC